MASEGSYDVINSASDMQKWMAEHKEDGLLVCAAARSAASSLRALDINAWPPMMPPIMGQTMSAEIRN